MAIQQGTATFAGVGTTFSGARQIFRPTITIAGTGTLAAPARQLMRVSATFKGFGLMARQFPASATLTGNVNILFIDPLFFVPLHVGPRWYISFTLAGEGSLYLDAEWVGNDKVWPNVVPDAGSAVLYQNAAGLEKAEADVDAWRLTRTYAELIKDQWDPYAISSNNLPYLAWAVGVNLWEDDWSDEFRRWWVANQWTFKEQRGSRLGLANFVNAVGGELLKVIAPPAKFFPGKTTTATDRANYVARFQQLRIYPYAQPVQLAWLCFICNFPVDPVTGVAPTNKNGNYMGPLQKFYPTASDAGGPFIRFATLYDPRTNQETPLTMRIVVNEDMGTSPVTTWDEVVLPAHKGDKWYLGPVGAPFKWPLPAGHPVSEDPRSTFLGALSPTAAALVRVPRDGSLDLSLAKAQYQTILPSGQPLNVNPEMVATEHKLRPFVLYPGSQPSQPGDLFARAYISFATIPLPGDTLVINGSTWTFVQGTTEDNQTEIQWTLVDTINALARDLSVSLDPNIMVLKYRAAVPPTAPGSAQTYALVITAGASGEWANAVTLDVSGCSAATASSPTLIGGTGPDVALTGKDHLTLGWKFLAPSIAWRYLFERWYIFDPLRVPDHRKASVYMGQARLGIQNYTAEAKIKMLGTWRPWFIRCNGYVPRFFRKPSTATIDKLRRAVTASMALRDTVRIDTVVQRVLNTNDSLPCDGSFSVGEYIDVDYINAP